MTTASKQIIDIGSAPNQGTYTPARVAPTQRGFFHAHEFHGRLDLIFQILKNMGTPEAEPRTGAASRQAPKKRCKNPTNPTTRTRYTVPRVRTIKKAFPNVVHSFTDR